MSEYSIAMANDRLVLHADARLEHQARALLGKAKDILSSRDRSKSEPTTIDFGWARFIVTRNGDSWTVHEPTFRGEASVNTRDDVSLSLAVVFRQLAFVRLLGLEPQEVSFKDTLIYVPKNIRDRKLCMERSEKTQAGDSGWYVGPVDAAQSDMVSRYTCELVHVRPSMLDALLLPEGSLVTWDGDEIESVFPPGAETSVWTESMRAQRAAWPALP